MTEIQFLSAHVFKGLTNLNEGADKDTVFYFSQEDFSVVLKHAEHFGLGLYGINTWLDNESYGATLHEDHGKKATDPRWYRKAFKTFSMRQEGLLYSATYKVSVKLLNRYAKASWSKEEE